MPSHVWLFATLRTVAHQVLLSMGFFWQEYWKVLVSQSCPTLVTPWTVACQAPLSMESSKQEYWNGFQFLTPGDLPDSGIEHVSLALAGRFFTTSVTMTAWQKSIIPRWQGFEPWVGKIPWKKKCQPTPVFLPEASHGQKSLAGYCPWGCKELDMTEWLTISLNPKNR